MARVTRNSAKRLRDNDSIISSVPVKRVCPTKRRVAARSGAIYSLLDYDFLVRSTKRRLPESTLITLTPKQPRSNHVSPDLDLSAIVSLDGSTGYVTEDNFSPLSLQDSLSDVEEMEMTTPNRSVRVSRARLADKAERIRQLKYIQATDVIIDSMPLFAPKNVHG
jgi:hypothetical protein